MDIKVFGTATSGHKLIITVISDLLDRAKIAYSISEINDVSQFLEKGIESIPAIQMDDEPIIGLKTNGSFSKTLREVVNHILASKNFGQLSKFIIPIDFSDVSINALSYGHRLATELGAVTNILHVYKPKPNLDQNQNVTSVSQSDNETRLNELVKGIDMDWCSDILKASFVYSTFKVGFPSEVILDSIDNNLSELVIMGTTGSGDSIKKWYGSVSLDVVSKSPIPILLVPKDARYQGINKILLALDYAGMDDSKLNSLIKLCIHFKSEVYIVHVSNDADQNFTTQKINKTFEKFKVVTSIIDGENVVLTLNQYAMNNNIDLVAISPRSKSIFSHFFKESITEQMTMTSGVPILVLK